MQDAKILVPSFGNWDYGTDIPYTTVFEKVRANKDGKSGIAKEKDDKSCEISNKNMTESYAFMAPQYDTRIHPTSGLPSDKRSAHDEWDPRKKAWDVHSSSSRRSSLEQIADNIFMESQHAAGNESPVVSRQSSSNTWQRNHLVGVIGGDSREPHVRDHCVNQSVPSSAQGFPSYPHHHHGLQVMAGRMPPSHNGPRHHHHAHEVVASTLQGAVGSPRKDRLFSNTSIGSHSLYNAHQLVHTAGSNADVPPTRLLPKFGDWNSFDPSGVEFTVIFDKARNERKCSVNQDLTPPKKVPTVADEDLYKPTFQRRSGLWSLFCCSCSSMS